MSRAPSRRRTSPKHRTHSSRASARDEVASALHAELDQNVNDYYEGEIPHEEFHRRQRGVWGRIRQAQVEDQVLARIRSELPTAATSNHASVGVGRPDMEREIRAVTSTRSQ